MDLRCSPGSLSESQCPHFSREGNGVHCSAGSICDVTHVIGSTVELQLEKVSAVF